MGVGRETTANSADHLDNGTAYLMCILREATVRSFRDIPFAGATPAWNQSLALRSAQLLSQVPGWTHFGALQGVLPANAKRISCWKVWCACGTRTCNPLIAKAP